MNVKDSIKKVGAVAASTLMVGMTMGAAQSLSEFPGMFVDDEGSPTAQVVVGSQGAVSDVVGAVNVAAALGQATIQTSEQTETVDVETSGSVGWSASDGQTLDTRNDNLYFGDYTDTVRQTLTQDHLDALSTVDFTDDAGNSQDVEHYLYTGNQHVSFGNPGDTSSQDPFLYVNNPSTVDGTSGNHLYELQANFGEGLAISDGDTDSNQDGNQDVLGEDIELFGKSFTISEDSFNSNNKGQLILYGSSDEYDLETGQSTTVTINGNDHTLEVRAVTDSETVAFYVDGQLREKTEGTTFNVDGTDVRVDDVIQTSDSNSEGLVTFSIGSEEYVLQDGSTIEDSDGNDIEGTHVNLEGTNVGSSDHYGSGGTSTVEISSINVAVGAADSDDSYVEAGGTFQDPVFDGLRFHFGGLAPDAAQGTSENVGEVSFSTSGDDTATVSMTGDSGSDATLEYFYDNDLNNEGSGEQLADSDGHKIGVHEGEAVTQDDYFAADAGDFSHMFEVRSVDREDPSTSGAEATVDLRDAVTGSTVEVDLDTDGGTSSNGDFYGQEVIDGQTYHFHLDGDTGQSDTDANLYVAWGTGASADGDGVDVGATTSVYPALDTDSGSAVSFVGEGMESVGQSINSSTNFNTHTVELPSTESSSAREVTVSSEVGDFDSSGGTEERAKVSVGDTSFYVSAGDGNTGVSKTVGVNVGQLTYNLQLTGLDNPSSTTDITTSQDTFDVSSVGLHGDQTATVANGDDTSGATANEAGAVVFEPEDSNDEEHAYVVRPDDDGNDGEVEVHGEDAGTVTYSGGGSAAASQSSIADNGQASWTQKQLDSDDDMYVGYDTYGTYTEIDTASQGGVTLYLPDQQATAGAAFTGASGSLDMGGTSSGSGEVTYTGVTNEDIRGALPDIAKTDEQVTSSDRQNSHLILVGGPAVNTLVADLASQGETWTADQWRNEHVDEALLQVVEDAFADGQHAMIVAGHSADDTRAAARYISEWRSHQDTLEEAGMQYSPSSQEAPR